MKNQEHILQITVKDLKEDLAFLNTLIQQIHHKLNQFNNLLYSNRALLSQYEKLELQDQIAKLTEKTKILIEFVHNLDEKPASLAATDDLNNHIQTTILACRFLLRQVANTTCLVEWQSPSFAYSVIPNRGLQQKPIIQALNDYKRDQHELGRNYESLFIKEYLPKNYLLPYHAYLTNSGMSALTTIVAMLKTKSTADLKVLIGKSVYFEEKILLKTFFPDALEFSEDNFEELKEHLETFKPDAIFVDSMTNNNQPRIIQLTNLIDLVSKNSTKKVSIVIDNTLTPVKIPKYSFSSNYLKKIDLIYWESLIKYHQYGLDLTYAGIVYSNALGFAGIYTSRDHLGTNCSDFSAALLPLPDQQLLKSRLRRHHRNISLIADIVSLQHKPGFESFQIIPAVKVNPAYKKENIYSSLGVISSNPVLNKNKMQKLLKKILIIAVKRKINLVGGTSFGFQTTRVYIPASRPGQGVPFFRIAAGCEVYSQILLVAQTISDAINEL